MVALVSLAYLTGLRTKIILLIATRLALLLALKHIYFFIDPFIHPFKLMLCSLYALQNI